MSNSDGNAERDPANVDTEAEIDPLEADQFCYRDLDEILSRFAEDSDIRLELTTHVTCGDIRDLVDNSPTDSADSDADDNDNASTCRQRRLATARSDLQFEIAKRAGRLANCACCRTPNGWSVPALLQCRERGAHNCRTSVFGATDVARFNSLHMPDRCDEVDKYRQQVFCVKFNADGSQLVTAAKDQFVRFYDYSQNGLRLSRRVKAKDVGYSILDVAFSPDGQRLIYSSWSDYVHCISLTDHMAEQEVFSMDPLHVHHFCLFSVTYSADSSEIVGAANQGFLYLYDCAQRKRTDVIQAHDDDVSSVRFADGVSHVLYSGGDDGLVKVWDRRLMSEQRPLPVGILAGHQDGVTAVDANRDGRYVISNSKDQSLKLWDIRRFSTERSTRCTIQAVASQNWDYRWQMPPKRFACNQYKPLRNDDSLATFRGHSVISTLIRCYFSPDASTGQQYIVTGSGRGDARIYNVATGAVEVSLPASGKCVRDVAWHPYEPTLYLAGWNCALLEWSAGADGRRRAADAAAARPACCAKRVEPYVLRSQRQLLSLAEFLRAEPPQRTPPPSD